jgi:MATE family multidrug resistance protein
VVKGYLMKRGLFRSYISGICDVDHGESFTTIFRLFYPEFIYMFVLYSLVNLLDAGFVAQLNSTSTYAMLGVNKTLLNFLTKIAEALAIVVTITAGQHNGAKEYTRAGQAFVENFWVIVVVATVICGSIYCCAPWIYWFLGVPDKMIPLGVPFLRWRVLALFFTFLYFGFSSFLKGVKNTQLPMRVFVAGAAVFVFFDYALIFGKFGFPEMQFIGSAVASCIQYFFMLCVIAVIILFNKNYRKYSIGLFKALADWTTVKRVAHMSWPVIVDKATVAGSYLWLQKLIGPMGKCVIASFGVIKDAELVIFMPALAMAQIVTVLVSNDFGRGNLSSIKPNIKKVLFLSSMMVFVLVLLFVINPAYFIGIFDLKHRFTSFAATALRVLSLFIFFDLLQLILAAAMRGMGNVRYVMYVRVVGIFGCFVPGAYFASCLPIESPLVKFILVYGMFYVTGIVMSVLYIRKFRSDYLG